MNDEQVEEIKAFLSRFGDHTVGLASHHDPGRFVRARRPREHARRADAGRVRLKPALRHPAENLSRDRGHVSHNFSPSNPGWLIAAADRGHRAAGIGLARSAAIQHPPRVGDFRRLLRRIDPQEGAVAHAAGDDRRDRGGAASAGHGRAGRHPPDHQVLSLRRRPS